MFYDKEFLKQLDQMKNKTTYAKVTALSVNELPLSQIQGKVTQGSINIDGASAIRRTCSLTLVADEYDYNDYLWGLNTKFKLEIGVKNLINPIYPDIIWFNQGIYVITSLNTSRSVSNFTFTIQGKDKMCLLNGEVGGTIGVQTDFGTIEEENNEGIWTIRQLPIVDIIKNMVHSYGGEPYHNIIIKDLEDYGRELLEYRYENVPLVFYRQTNKSHYENLIFGDSPSQFYLNKDLTGTSYYLSQIPEETFEQLIDTLDQPSNPTTYYFEDGERDDEGNLCGYYLTKLQYGDAAGYRLTDLTYAGELIANVGESVTSVLDKIKNMLVEYEYFYDVDGHFIFQKKQSVMQTMWSLGNDQENEVTESLAARKNIAYEFHGSELISAFNNNPNLLNIRNDFSIWGERKSVSGAAIPIHLRYAVDKKPTSYTTIGNFTQGDLNEIEEYNEKYGTSIKVESPTQFTYSTEPNYNRIQNYIYVEDWREVLHRMAKDYFQYNFLTNFDNRLKQANPNILGNKTGYEQYYTDIEVCWRTLYNPELLNKIEETEERLETNKSLIKEKDQLVLDYKDELAELNDTISSTENKTTLDSLMIEAMEVQKNLSEAEIEQQKLKTKIEDDEERLISYKSQLENYYQITDLNKVNCQYRELTSPIWSSGISYIKADKVFKIPYSKISSVYDEKEQEIPIAKKDILYSYQDMHHFIIKKIENSYAYCEYYKNEKLDWNKNVYLNQSALNYWFDFLDVNGELDKFSVQAIGARTKAINETNVKSIYYRKIPKIIFTEDITKEKQISGYRYIQIANLDTMFTISAQGKSAKDRLDELLYNHGYCNESATITTIPIYYLQPNTRVHIFDPKTKIEGDYIISKISLPLSYNGTMSLTATKAADIDSIY